MSKAFSPHGTRFVPWNEADGAHLDDENRLLFKVTDNIYQVRGYDLSNITFIEGKDGWLCPALMLYFSEAPAKLYVQVKAAG